jgi:hypothetical protein
VSESEAATLKLGHCQGSKTQNAGGFLLLLIPTLFCLFVCLIFLGFCGFFSQPQPQHQPQNAKCQRQVGNAATLTLHITSHWHDAKMPNAHTALRSYAKDPPCSWLANIK